MLAKGDEGEMYICFAEYKILPEHRAQYIIYTKGLLAESGNSVYLYEGTDQPGLFVEVWNAASEAEAERIKKERCSERSSWFRIASWISGGMEKMHVWTFKPVHQADKFNG
ncbi:hypothetical protein [Paenibacillus sp. sgz302251]|uniref:hypothetical protein n=1 Tax=Paenibacillus sp. sgz302251 TaxID=3414493 RepID=UPI003C7CAD90